MAVRLTGWRYAAFVGSFGGFLGIFVYTGLIRPFINPEPYKILRRNVKAQLPPQD